MRTRPYAVRADTQAVVSLTTFLSPPATCRPTNDAQLRQKSAGNDSAGSAGHRNCFLGEGQGRKWREGEEGCSGPCWWPACPQGGSSALGTALWQGQPDSLAGATAGSGSWGGQTRRSACFTWHSPAHRLMLCGAFAEAAAATEAAPAPQAGNVHWAFHRKHLPTLARTPFKPCCASVGPSPLSWGPELRGGHRAEPEGTGSTSSRLSA